MKKVLQRCQKGGNLNSCVCPFTDRNIVPQEVKREDLGETPDGRHLHRWRIEGGIDGDNTWHLVREEFSGLSRSEAESWVKPSQES
jgi:hypothetical protein